MPDFQSLNESTLRLSVIFAVFAAMVLWEHMAPRRRQEIPKLLRWSNNLALILLDVLIIRFAFPVLAVGLSITMQERGWGLLNAVSLPSLIESSLAFLVLDLAIYCQHLAFHSVPLLWRLHRVHHADLEIDVSTGLRFHPLEMLLSMAIKLLVVALLGAPALAILVFEIVLNASSMFNHGNARVSTVIEQKLRWLVVTPDMHRVHHSIIPSEYNSNFGFNFSWWDRLFGTYMAHPRDGHLKMRIGIEQFRTSRDLWLDRMLMQPFRKSTPKSVQKPID